MSFSFKKIPEKKIKACFDYEDQKLNVVIDAAKITQKQVNDFNNRSHDYAGALAVFIESWDATDGPPDYKFLQTLPFSFLASLFFFCMGEIAPKKTKDEA